MITRKMNKFTPQKGEWSITYYLRGWGWGDGDSLRKGPTFLYDNKEQLQASIPTYDSLVCIPGMGEAGVEGYGSRPIFFPALEGEEGEEETFREVGCHVLVTIHESGSYLEAVMKEYAEVTDKKTKESTDNLPFRDRLKSALRSMTKLGSEVFAEGNEKEKAFYIDVMGRINRTIVDQNKAFLDLAILLDAETLERVLDEE